MLLLIRHGQSEANVALSEMHATPDVGIDLTPVGRRQAVETGQYLNQFLNTVYSNVTLWNSPYNRTRQTADLIFDQLSTGQQNRVSRRESIYLIERNFGMVSSHPTYFIDDDTNSFRRHYKLHTAEQAFFCKPPLGESPMDMAMRLDTFYHRYVEGSQERLHVVVCHGAAMRAFNMMVHCLPYEQFLISDNPDNAGVYLTSPTGLVEQFCPSIRT